MTAESRPAASSQAGLQTFRRGPIRLGGPEAATPSDTTAAKIAADAAELAAARQRDNDAAADRARRGDFPGVY